MFSHPKFAIGDMVRVVDGWDDDGYYTDTRKNVIIENNSLGVIIDTHFVFSDDGKPQYFVKWLDEENWQTVEAERDLIRVEQRAI